MVRPRMGSHPARLLAADADALTGTDRRATAGARPQGSPGRISGLASRAAEGGAIGAWLDAAAPPGRGAFRFVLEIALPWVGRQARSIALGCVVALGGCADADHVEVAGVVRDGRTGAPIARAQITTDDGRTLETDQGGRFAALARESVSASADGRCPARAPADGAREITLRLFDRLELTRDHAQVGPDAEVRLEVRTRCDAGAELTWTQIAGPELGDRMRVEDGGRVLVIRTHALEQLVGAGGLDPRSEYRFTVAGELGGERLAREARVVATPAVGRVTGARGLQRRPPRRPAALASARGAHDPFSPPRGRTRALPPGCESCHTTGVHAGTGDGGARSTRAGWAPTLLDGGAMDLAPTAPAREPSAWWRACHEDGAPPERAAHGPTFPLGACEGDSGARHPWLELDEWRLSGMSQHARASRDDDPALRAECAQCHSARGFVAWQRGRAHEPVRETAAPIACATCHDPRDASRPHALRVFDTVEPIGGARAEHLGSGAVCASCHRGGVANGTEPDRAAHAPQADVMIGRGARLVQPLDEGPHRFIANTCVRCHMTEPSDSLRGRAGGHTFSIRARSGEPVVSVAACAPCHGDAAPEAIGARDWDGDGARGILADEHERALERLQERLRARIARAAITGACGRRAAGVVDHDARLHLVDARGALLGDCDDDGRFDAGEAATTANALPRPLADAAHDLALLRADGSRGVHNPAYAFRVLAALDRALR